MSLGDLLKVLLLAVLVGFVILTFGPCFDVLADELVSPPPEPEGSVQYQELAQQCSMAAARL